MGQKSEMGCLYDSDTNWKNLTSYNDPDFYQAFFQFQPYFSTCPSIKPGLLTPIKLTFLESARIQSVENSMKSVTDSGYAYVTQ